MYKITFKPNELAHYLLSLAQEEVQLCAFIEILTIRDCQSIIREVDALIYNEKYTVEDIENVYRLLFIRIPERKKKG